MDSEEAVRESDPVYLACDQSESFPEDGAAHLAADDGLLDQHLRVVLPRGLHRVRQFFLSRNLADAEGRARTGRLNEDGIREAVRVDLLVPSEHPVFRYGDSRVAGD